MSFFTSEEAAALAATTVRVATLVDLMFSDAPVYIWNGWGQRKFAGKTYTGCGDLGSIEGLEEARSAVSQQVTFTLSAVGDSVYSDLLARVLDATDIVQGNLAIVSIQLFGDDWQTFGDPIAVYFGVMQPPRVTRQAATPTQGAVRTMTLPSENLFYGRARPPAGRYTDREQQQRFPGDRFCEYAPQLIQQSVVWPDYIWPLAAGLSAAAVLGNGIA